MGKKNALSKSTLIVESFFENRKAPRNSTQFPLDFVPMNIPGDETVMKMKNAGARQFVHTTIRTHDNSYTRHLVRKPKPDISYKSETRHFVQKRNQTFRTKMKPDISCNLYYTTYYYNVVSYVHIPLVL